MSKIGQTLRKHTLAANTYEFVVLDDPALEYDELHRDLPHPLPVTEYVGEAHTGLVLLHHLNPEFTETAFAPFLNATRYYIKRVVIYPNGAANIRLTDGATEALIRIRRK